MKIVVAFSLLGASPFLAAFACSPCLPPCFISLTKCDNYPDLTASSICLLRWIHSSVLISLGVFVRGETVLPPTRLMLALEIEPFVEVGSVAGFMISLGMPSVAFIVIDELWWELVELYPGGANEHGIKHVAPGRHCPPLYFFRCLEDLWVILWVSCAVIRLYVSCVLPDHDHFLRDFLLRKKDTVSLTAGGESRDWTPVRVLMSDAWVMGRGSPYYLVDNKVVAVRLTSMIPLPFCSVAA
ncbi:hypothetical protein Tco_1380101 [Tanacetum coccineum]